MTLPLTCMTRTRTAAEGVESDSMMKNRFLFLTHLLFLFSSGVSMAEGSRWYHNTLLCKQFRAEANTKFYYTADIFSQSTWQLLRITDNLGRHAVNLDLKQTRSKDAQLGGRKGIDRIAWTWECMHTNTGVDLLRLDFFCSHEDATSCPTAMDAPGTELTQIYDSHGRALLKNPPLFYKSDEALLHRLGLLHQFVNLPDNAHTLLVYPYFAGAMDDK